MVGVAALALQWLLLGSKPDFSMNSMIAMDHKLRTFLLLCFLLLPNLALSYPSRSYC